MIEIYMDVQICERARGITQTKFSRIVYTTLKLEAKKKKKLTTDFSFSK